MYYDIYPICNERFFPEGNIYVAEGNLHATLPNGDVKSLWTHAEIKKLMQDGRFPKGGWRLPNDIELILMGMHQHDLNIRKCGYILDSHVPTYNRLPRTVKVVRFNEEGRYMSTYENRCLVVTARNAYIMTLTDKTAISVRLVRDQPSSI